MKNILFMLLLVPLIIATDCDPPEPGPGPTNEDLVKKSWKVDKVFINDSEIDAANYSFNFKDDNTFSITAPDVDDPEFPSNGTWSYNDSSKTISLGSANLKVILINETEFILEYSYQNFKEGTIRFRFEMVPA